MAASTTHNESFRKWRFTWRRAIVAAVLSTMFVGAVIPAIMGGPIHLLFGLNASPADWGEYRWVRRFWLIPHAAGATIATLIGPFQFLAYSRRRWPVVHRGLGRVYVLASSVSAISAVALTYLMGNPDGVWSSMTLALLWLLAIAIGWRLAIRRRFDEHRDFMIRTYVFMMAFVFFGLFQQTFGERLSGTPEGVRRNLDWMYWLYPWIAVELWLSWCKALRR